MKLHLPLFTLAAILPLACTHTRQPALSRGDAAWAQIRAAVTPGGPPSPSDEHHAKWIIQSQRRACLPFFRLCASGPLQQNVDAYVDRFGRHGALADLAWFLATPDDILPTRHIAREAPPTVRSPDVIRLRQGNAMLNRALAKAQVTRFLNEPDTFTRYYNAVIWSTVFFGPPQNHTTAFLYSASELQKNFPAPSDADYFQYARQFMILAKATGRDDLLRNATPEDLRERFRTWHAWIFGPHIDIAGVDLWDLDIPFIHLKPDPKLPIWRIDPSWKNDVHLPPLNAPDRPFPDLSFALKSDAVRMFTWADAPDEIRTEITTLLRTLAASPSATNQSN